MTNAILTALGSRYTDLQEYERAGFTISYYAAK